uniref:Nd-s mutant fibroin light chain n=5 Tax=Bombyx mori TaxID=7091 RepID=Q17221_BOMMO|nr:Nd-s mutant fibroin light chain [Bombyx mori]
MKPIFLVLLVATSAYAAPSVTINQYSDNEIPRDIDDGKASSVISRAWDYVDDTDKSIAILNVQEILKDMASQGDYASQASAVAQTAGIIAHLSAGIPGDACAAANSMGSVISLSLTPANVYKLQDNIDGIHTKRIFTLVNLIARAYKNTAHVPNSITKKDFYRKITAELKTSIRNGDIDAYITEMLGDRYPKTVGKVLIEKRGAIVFETHLNRELERISNDAQWCFRGNDYYKPCNNTVFIHIMLVLIVFALMMLAIIFIFSKINENRNAYKRMCE